MTLYRKGVYINRINLVKVMPAFPVRIVISWPSALVKKHKPVMTVYSFGALNAQTGVRRTGRCFSPLTKLDLRRGTSPISSAFGTRFTSSSSMMLISIRARFAPRQ
jgi:hypothetical protein